MQSDRLEAAVTRYDTICDIVKDDKMGSQLVRDVVDSADRYVGVVLSFEARIKMANAPDSENWRSNRDRGTSEIIAELDSSRRLSHNALIDGLMSTNRYLFKNFQGKVPIGGLYSLPPETIRDRNAVGDWAGDLIFGLKKSYRKYSQDLTEIV